MNESDRWNYGDAVKRFPINKGEIWKTPNGSMVAVNDLMAGMPDFMLDADLIFVDPPWNVGNLNSFITKADMDNYKDDFKPFYKTLFQRIATINPPTCYVEIGKEFLADFMREMKNLYRYVTVYNSSYYHKKENICYVIRGSQKAKKPKLDYMDEEDIINWIGDNESYNCIGDICIGRGLVAMAAHRNGKRFVGCELNRKRLAVLLERIGGEWEIIKSELLYSRNKNEDLKDFVNQSGLRLDKFAELLGIKTSTLRNLLCGAQPVSDSNFEKSKNIAEKINNAIRNIN